MAAETSPFLMYLIYFQNVSSTAYAMLGIAGNPGSKHVHKNGCGLLAYG